MTYDLDHKADHYCPAYKKVISAPWDTSLIGAGTSVTISVRTFYEKSNGYEIAVQSNQWNCRILRKKEDPAISLFTDRFY